MVLLSLQTSSHKSHFQHRKLFFLIKKKKTKTNHRLQGFHLKLFQKCFWPKQRRMGISLACL